MYFYLTTLDLDIFSSNILSLMRAKILIILSLVIYCTATFGQSISPVKLDSLQGKDYGYFNEKLDSEELDLESEKVYSRAYLRKAKSEKNLPEMLSAYKHILHQSDKDQRILYVDSMIVLAKKIGSVDDIGSAYLTKGIVYYDEKNYINALDNYLTADYYLLKSKDKYLIYKVKYNIAQIKYYLGYYDEAIALFLECVDYFRKENSVAYLSSMHSLGLCYNRIGSFDLSKAINEQGIKEADRLQVFHAIPRFINSEGINQYFSKNYVVSIAKLLESLPTIEKKYDFSNIAVTNFYLGKNYWALKQPHLALPYFEAVDRSFRENNYIRPDLRETYELLIDYYKGENDEQNQKIYMKQLLIVDQFLSHNYKYLSQKLHREYDTKYLKIAIGEIEDNLNYSKKLVLFFSIISIVLIAAISSLLYRSNRNRKNQKFLADKKLKTEKEILSNKSPESLGINPELVNAIISQLDIFEKEKKFLIKDISLPKLAEMFDSNIVYVSKIISHHKYKKSVDYINDLRVGYIVEMLDSSSKFRNYTNKALGEEAGFSTTQNFTRAFGKTMGMSPTDYIFKVNKKFKI